MSKNRYGRIYHSDHRHINLRFPSVDARREFAEKFQTYHAEHDHDGEAPRFENITAQQAGSTTYESGKLHDAHSVTIDGYATYEIEEYHEDEKHTYYYRYQPPTCCVPPLISIDRKLIDSATLQRHELSAIFGDMPDEDYQSMLESVSNDGFIDNVVRLYEGQILDGYHRYRAAKELNLLRKLRFKQWHEDEHRDGDPRVFVYGRNQHRRHYSAARRAQVAVAFNERFGQGGDRRSDNFSKGQDEPLKTTQELAKEANVSTSTIKRAIQVEKQGESEAVISGEKTAGEVIKARDAATAMKRKKQVLKNLYDIRKQAATDYVGEGDTQLNQYLSLDDLEKGFVKNNASYAEAFQSGIKRIDKAVSFNHFQDLALEVDEFGNAKVDISDLEEEHRAIMTYAGDIRQWQRPDWSPDTNWILPLIEAKKKAKAKVPGDLQAGVDEMKSAEVSHHDDRDREGETHEGTSSVSPRTSAEAADPEPQPDLKTLREQVKAQIPKYKQWYKNEGYKESDLVSRASFSQLIHVLREYRQTAQDGAATIEELKDLLDILKSKSYPFAHKLRQIVRPEQPESDEVSKSSSLGEKIEQLRSEIREYLPTWKADNPRTDAATFFQLVDARYRIKHGIERGTGPFFFEELQPLLALMKNNDIGLADKVREMLGTGSGVSSVTDEQPTDADEVASEVSPQPSGCEDTFARNSDTSLAEIDNLPAVKYFLQTLGKQVGTVEHPTDRDDLSSVIFEAFTEHFEGVTEREQLSILIDCAHSLVAESM